MFVLKDNPVALPTLVDFAGRAFPKLENPDGNARVATLALDDDDCVGRSESFMLALRISSSNINKAIIAKARRADMPQDHTFNGWTNTNSG